MKARSQYYSLMHEAMYENGLTTGHIAAEVGNHYTYIYNLMRQQSNMSFDTAERIARGAGYQMEIVLRPIDPSTHVELKGDVPADIAVFTGRKARKSKKTAEAAAPAPAVEDTPEPAPAPAEASVEALVDELMAEAEAEPDLDAELRELGLL